MWWNDNISAARMQTTFALTNFIRDSNSDRFTGTLAYFLMQWDCLKFYHQSGCNIVGIYTEIYVKVVQRYDDA